MNKQQAIETLLPKFKAAFAALRNSEKGDTLHVPPDLCIEPVLDALLRDKGSKKTPNTNPPTVAYRSKAADIEGGAIVSELNVTFPFAGQPEWKVRRFPSAVQRMIDWHGSGGYLGTPINLSIAYGRNVYECADTFAQVYRIIIGGFNAHSPAADAWKHAIYGN